MPKEKRKRDPFGIFGFNKDLFMAPESFARGGSGYSISVTYDEKGKPMVRVQTHGDVDVAEMRRDIEQRYPGAKIEGLEKQPLIRFVDEEQVAEERKPKKKQGTAEKKRKAKREPLIRVVE